MIKHSFLVLAVTAATISYAKDLGQYGTSFKIAEPSMLEFIHAKLDEASKNGTIDKINKDFVKRVKKHVNNPTQINLTRTGKTKVFTYYPTVTLNSDLKDTRGKILVAKGTTVNALERLSFYEPNWMFINASDTEQIKWAISKLKVNTDIKIILTGGAIRKSQKTFDKRVYFDQEGRITQKLGIEHVPALVKRKGNALQITELNIDGGYHE